MVCWIGFLDDDTRTRCSERVKTRSLAANKSRIPCMIRSFRLSSSLVLGERLGGRITPMLLPEVAGCP